MAVREEKDATLQERMIKEINVGVYCIRSLELFSALKAIKLNLKKKEFYLTDIIELFVKKNLKVAIVETKDPVQGLGINSKNELAEAEGVIRNRILKRSSFSNLKSLVIVAFLNSLISCWLT